LQKELKLKIETKPRDDHQVTLIVELESEQMEGAKHRASRRISERKKIPGFRPGKAPYEVVVRSFGEGVIVEEAVDILIDEVYPRAIEEAKLEPGAYGSLEKVENLEKAPKFTFTVPLAPSVDLGDYRSIRLPYDWTEPSEDKVVESLEELRQMYARTESVDRPIQKGDFVMIDLKGFKAKPGEHSEPLIDRPGLPIFVRADAKPEEFPFPGFSNELIGLSPNETKSFKYRFKKDDKDEKLQGLTVQFSLTVKLVRGTTLPEMDDNFAKQVGAFENLQALREAVKANLASQSRAQYDDDYFFRLMEKIKGGAVIKYPPQAVDHEVEHVMEDLKSRLAGQNLDLATYLKSREMDEEKFLAEEARPIAIKRLERSLVMDAIAKAENIEVSQELLQSSFQQTLGEFQGDTGFQKMMRGKSQPPRQLMNAVAMESANRAYIQQTLNRLKDIATGQAPEIADGSSLKGKAKKTTAKKATSAKKASHSRAAAPKTNKIAMTTENTTEVADKSREK
jgi:trigger factor